VTCVCVPFGSVFPPVTCVCVPFGSVFPLWPVSVSLLEVCSPLWPVSMSLWMCVCVLSVTSISRMEGIYETVVMVLVRCA